MSRRVLPKITPIPLAPPASKSALRPKAPIAFKAPKPVPTFYAGVFGEVEMTPAEQEAAQAELRGKKSQTDEPGPTDVPPPPPGVPWAYGGPSKSKKEEVQS